MMPEYSTSKVASSMPFRGLASWGSLGMPSKPITLAANEPSTLPQICSRSSLKDMPAFLHSFEQFLQETDLALRRRQLREPLLRLCVALLGQLPVDLPRPPDQPLLDV